MSMMGQEKPSLEDLEHHGVKGMHWGKRRGITDVHLEKVKNEISRRNRVVKGKASTLDKIRVAQATTIPQIVKNGGFKNTAKVQTKQLQDHRKRIQNGEKKIRDVLAIYGSLSLTDLAKASRATK